MIDKVFQGSLTRITDFDRVSFDCQSLPREQWEAGDYVLGRVSISRGGFSAIELRSGRLIQAVEGDSVLGALGVRHATLEMVGSWKEVAADGRMHLLTAAGLLGLATSVSGTLGAPMLVEYQGHAMRKGTKLRMADFAKAPSRTHEYNVPTILVIGTSMSAGKTTSAKIIVRQLKREGYRVIGAKLTGAGRYRDILAMRDAGADAIFDFVDAGLPSSVLDPEDFRPRLRDLLGLIVEAKPDLVVAEAGASPLEPYNGDTALEEIQGSIAMTVLCASDPYAVVGIMRGYQMMRPDLVAGIATSTHRRCRGRREAEWSESAQYLGSCQYPRAASAVGRCPELTGPSYSLVRAMMSARAGTSSGISFSRRSAGHSARSKRALSGSSSTDSSSPASFRSSIRFKPASASSTSWPAQSATSRAKKRVRTPCRANDSRCRSTSRYDHPSTSASRRPKLSSS